MRRLSIVASAVACLLALAGCGSGGSTAGDNYVANSGEGQITYLKPAQRKPAPTVSGKDLEGKPLTSASYAGKTIVVNVWGSWCPPCRKEAPTLAAVATELKAKDVQFLGISVQESAATTLAFTREHKTPYPTISDYSGTNVAKFTKSLPSIAIPTTWVIDAKGRVAARIAVDDITRTTLRDVIEQVQESTS